jgi:uncharacterized protein (TIRG00374 family)
VRTRGLRPARLVATVLGLALAAVVIAVSHPDRIWSTIQEVDAGPLIWALVLNIPIVLLRAIRAQALIGHLRHPVPMRAMVPIQLVGQTSSSLTPAASGDYVRAYLWRQSNGVPLRVGAAVVSFERLYSLGLLAAVSVLLIVLPRHGVLGWIAVGLGLLLATFSPLIFELLPPSLERWALGKVTRGKLLGRFAEGAQVMVEQIRALMRAPLLLAWTSFLTLLIFIAGGGQVWLVLNSLDHLVPMTQAVAASTTSQVAGIISTLPFGIGSQDAILVTVFAGYGVTVALAATVAVLVRATSTLPQGLAGLVAYLLVEKPDAQRAMEVE